MSQHNLALYRFLDSALRDKTAVHTLGKRLGLHRLDNNICADSDQLTSIEVRKNTGQHEYIPYSSRKLSWHTDGYYNTKEKQING
ncbi:MAG: taurine catabolism dioxygenase TauD, partial [Thiotrichaceae bacterium]